jgi:hypothetical protein
MKLIIQTYIFIISFLIPMSTYAFTNSDNASDHIPKLDAFAEVRTTMCVADGRQLVSNLFGNYGETIFALSGGTAINLKGEPTKIQLVYLRNAITKSFTILEIHPTGKGCITAAGENFEFLDMEIQKPKVPESKI